MNVTEALEQLANINPEARDEIRLLIDCPHCGRSGELGSLRPMLQATPGHTRSEGMRERSVHDADLRRISIALGLPWPTSVDNIVDAIRVRPR